jgi:hypothetical protein
MCIVLSYKTLIMARDHVPTPGDTSKEQHQTGKPTKMKPEDMPMQDDMTERYTDDDNDIADHVRVNNPNRNPGKDTEGH